MYFFSERCQINSNSYPIDYTEKTFLATFQLKITQISYGTSTDIVFKWPQEFNVWKELKRHMATEKIEICNVYNPHFRGEKN